MSHAAVGESSALLVLALDIRDYQFSNGVIGKLVTYNLTERE